MTRTEAAPDRPSMWSLLLRDRRSAKSIGSQVVNLVLCAIVAAAAIYGGLSGRWLAVTVLLMHLRRTAFELAEISLRLQSQVDE